MTPEIRLLRTDDAGNPTEHVYHLDGSLNTLEQIEQAVAHFQQQALPPVEKALLEGAQQGFVEQEKKRSCQANGRRRVCVKCQEAARCLCVLGAAPAHCCRRGEPFFAGALLLRAASTLFTMGLHWATRLSFKLWWSKGAQRSGARLVSEDSRWRLVEQEAQGLDFQQEQPMTAIA